jgi:hypothetical protein
LSEFLATLGAGKPGICRTQATTRADDGDGSAAQAPTPPNKDWKSSKGVAMKATLMQLAALLVSVLTLNAASAQSPYPVPPPGYGYPGYGQAQAPAPGPYTSNFGGGAPAAPSGGCATCGDSGCSSCAKGSMLGKLGLKSSGGCSSCNKCGGLCGCFKGWLCKPFPSDAPVLKHAEYPLGFPNHPYIRSPRDYFMDDGH